MRVLLWEKRMSKFLTLQELAELTGISTSTLCRIENELVSPSLENLERIAIALGIRITDLFESEHK